MKLFFKLFFILSFAHCSFFFRKKAFKDKSPYESTYYKQHYFPSSAYRGHYNSDVNSYFYDHPLFYPGLPENSKALLVLEEALFSEGERKRESLYFALQYLQSIVENSDEDLLKAINCIYDAFREIKRNNKRRANKKIQEAMENVKNFYPNFSE